MRYTGANVTGRNFIVTREEEGGTHVLAIPIDAFSIRAGEYGLDVEKDAEAIWDILLHENEASTGETLSLLVTEDTLEAARDKHLERCRAVRDSHYEVSKQYSRKQDEDHIDVLDALVEKVNKDSQLAVLFRERTKEMMLYRKEVEARPKFTLKSKLIDNIREREGI